MASSLDGRNSEDVGVLDDADWKLAKNILFASTAAKSPVFAATCIAFLTASIDCGLADNWK